MAVTTTLKPGYKWKTLIFAFACVAAGIWGIYDYAYAIPRQQEAHERLTLAESMVNWLDRLPNDDTYDAALAEAKDGVEAEIRGLEAEARALIEQTVKEVEAEGGQATQERIEEAFNERLQARGDAGWYGTVAIFASALQSPRIGGARTGIHLEAYKRASSVRGELAEIEKPAKWNRLMQWGFILCLPFAPWLFWTYVKQKRSAVTLDDGGSLHLPGHETWQREQIAGIDMSKWMAKSVAWAVHADGRRFKLDDYIHRDMHLIVGALAHRFEPDKWTEDARVVKPEGEDDFGHEFGDVHGEHEPAELDAETGEPMGEDGEDADDAEDDDALAGAADHVEDDRTA